MRIALTAMLVALASLSPSRPAPAQQPQSLQALVRSNVRYVFVIYQENRSFDHYFGTFPGANGIYGKIGVPGFRQYNAVAQRWTRPFRVTTSQLGLQNNARAIVEAGIDGGKMDGFVGAQAKWALSLPPAARKTLGMTSDAQAASVGDESMAYVDCDTIPYLWLYASRFALFDSFFQGVRAPSAPSNVEIISAQNGETEYARYGAAGPPYTANPIGKGGRGVPMFVDLDPAWGPYNKGAHTQYRQVDQTYANVLLNLEGTQAQQLKQYTHDIRDDIAFLSVRNQKPVHWTWYQQGFANPADPHHLLLVTHHLAPHFFGYIANNPSMNRGIADISRFDADVAAGNLGSAGVFYLKGGYGSDEHLRPLHAARPHTYLGDDDHPGEADMQIAEAHVAHLVNTIARSRYWNNAAIVITWDDPGGYWDHVRPPKWLVCPDGKPCGNGQRVPMILISPFARTSVVHEFDDQASVVKFIERIFNRTALASFPDEAKYGPYGPRDLTTTTGDLTGGFDPARLRGERPPIAPDKAIISDAIVNRIPSPSSCRSIGLRTVPPPAGTSAAPPAGFDPSVLAVPLPHAAPGMVGGD
jgi:phospholipase C